MTHRRLITLTLLALPGLLLAGAVAAQDFPPKKTVTLVVGFAPGGAADAAARLIAKKLGENIGQTVIVDNKAGAGGNIAHQQVANGPVDGSVLLFGSIGPLTIAPHMMKVGYDPFKDLAPISGGVYFPNMLVVNANSGIRNLADFIAAAKKSAGNVTFASTGSGSASHLAGELFNMMANVKTVHVPYKGGGHARTELLGGQVDFMFHNITAVLGDTQAGRLRGLAVTGPKRALVAPEIPTMDEAALRGYNITSWFGVMAPTGVSPEIVARLNRDFVKVMQLADIRDKLATLGSEAVGGSADNFAKHLRAEHEKWGKLVKQAGISME